MLERHNRVEYYAEKHFGKKEELKLTKMMLEIFNNISKIATAGKIWSQRFQSCLIVKNNFFEFFSQKIQW